MNDHPHEIEHPHDLLPGFALGALDAAETLDVVTHLQDCPGCRDEVESFRATVCLLPYTAATHEPPSHVKQQLFARVAALQQHSHATRRAMPAAPQGASGWTRWSKELSAAALLLALVFGVATLNMQSRLNDATAQLALASQARGAANDEQQLIAFVSDPSTVSRPLDAKQAGTHGRMFMQPGHSKAVIMLNGLTPMRADQSYRCWLAKANQPVPVCTITATSDGAIEIMFEAPAAIDTYEQVMVTIESASNTTQPSKNVVLQASIS